MAKIQAVWAIDIGQAALKALKLVPGSAPDRVEAVAFDFIEYPKILSQPDADPEQSVHQALETFIERNDLKNCQVAIAVPGQAGLVKFIKLPPVEKKRIPDIVKFEAKQQIPFALEEVIWAYQQIGDEEEAEEDFTMAEVGLFAMKRDQINRAILPFRAVGIEVDLVQMGPIALYNFITFDQLKGNDLKGSVVLLDIGADNTDLIITDGTRIWQRNVPIGGNHFTRALTKELKLTFAKAEHLKRNATKAPDPRAVFTAMRGVFNDFASEINRSIGFYSSVNRTAKIVKVVGLGNGFKLPGLQKFLQQNLNHEVEKLETFDRMDGDEVKGAPQFQENLPSFGVAYGLAVQGLRRGGLRTNLLPPEVERVRLIRAKKPWALAASALLLLAFSSLFLGDYRVLAKVSRPEFKAAVDQADQASKAGAQFKSEFESAKQEWEAKLAEGKSLVVENTERAVWPNFLKTINDHLPDPIRDFKLDPKLPSDQPKLDKLRVHIDAIKPVWRSDVATEWFDAGTLSDHFKNLMHKLDRSKPPEGEGWIIQIVGHHYNPRPTAEERKLVREGKMKQISFGPYGYLTEKILPALMKPSLRLFGVHHVALAWMTSDQAWTPEKAGITNGLASNTVPILDRAAPSVPEGEEGMMGMPGMGMPGMGMPGMMGPGMGGMGRGMGGSDGMMGMGMPGMGPGMGMPGMGMPGMDSYGPMGMRGNLPQEKDKLTTLTRTDFLIQFVWQPPKPEDQPKTEEERKERLAEIEKELAEAEKNLPAVAAPTEAQLQKDSLEKSEVVTKDLLKAQAQQPVPGTAPAAPGTAPAAPGTTPAAPGTTPAAPGTAPAAPGTPK